MEFEREFLIRLATTWLAARLAVMGGFPQIAQHSVVKDFHTLGFNLMGCLDYAAEMKLVLEERKTEWNKSLKPEMS